MNFIVTTQNLLEASMGHGLLKCVVNVSLFTVYINMKEQRRIERSGFKWASLSQYCEPSKRPSWLSFFFAEPISGFSGANLWDLHYAWYGRKYRLTSGAF